MKAIALRQALINASYVTIDRPDALTETSVLKQLIESCKVRVEELESTAKQMAEEILQSQGITSGKFEHNGHHYTLDLMPVYDMVGKPQRYTMEEGVKYRQLALQQKNLKRESAEFTQDMKLIMDKFPKFHPNFEPDEIKQTLKCLD